MSKRRLQLLSNEELIALYKEAALEHRKATDLGNPKEGNKAHDVVAAAYRELKRRGPGAQR